MIESDTLLRAVRKTSPSALIVSHLGDTSNRLFAVADDPDNLYVLGAMGSVLPLALGISLTTERKVIAIEGDGGCLMSLGSLATIARYAPPNLSILILDNAAYGSTGGQPSATHGTARLDQVARGAGIENTQVFEMNGSEEAIGDWLDLRGLRFGVARTAFTPSPYPFVPLTPAGILRRFNAWKRQPVMFKR